jgi:hypothetical protein
LPSTVATKSQKSPKVWKNHCTTLSIPVAWTSSDEAKRPNGRRCLESLRRVKSLG